MAITVDRMKQKLAHARRNIEYGEASQTGQTSAFEALFRENWNRVCNILFRLVGDRDEAEDLALEVFWRLYRRPADRGQDPNLHGWLYRVATNLGYNALRSRKRRQQYEEEAGRLDLEHGDSAVPDAAIDQVDERQTVRRALAQMKPRSAQLLVLRSSGLSYAEIAQSLGVSPTSVGTLLVRAEQEFEKQYQAVKGW
ncbi:MAG: sigma-70 family RNA polymerase sigma factor [Omnitrophica WOR_2 bacterium]